MSIDIVSNKCCGCGVCKFVCPQQCISMKVNKDGFLYPVINKNECINCGLCEKKCPVLIQKNATNDSSTKCFAVKALDESIIKNSSSGGVFSVVANWIIDNKGVVVGAAFDEKNQVVHSIADSKNELIKLRGSKYVQSDLRDVILKMKEFLEQDRYVFFTGTSCQVQAVINYFNGKYDKLLTADMVCHGVPTPKLWREYMKYQENKYHSKIVAANFRDKSFGWEKYSLCLKFENGREYRKKNQYDPYMRMFLQNSFLRESCFQCEFKNINRNCDFTFSDFWRVSHSCQYMDDDKGTSLVFIHSKRGNELFNLLKTQVISSEVTMEQALFENSAVNQSSQCPSNRVEAIRKLGVEPFKKVYKETCIPLWRDMYRRMKYKIRQEWIK